jgi:hypothetical protein
MSLCQLEKLIELFFSLVLNLLSFRCEFYTACLVLTISIDEPCEIVGLEWIDASGLLACGVQGQVHATVVG